jgi:hypothetical protein
VSVFWVIQKRAIVTDGRVACFAKVRQFLSRVISAIVASMQGITGLHSEQCQQANVVIFCSFVVFMSTLTVQAKKCRAF